MGGLQGHLYPGLTFFLYGLYQARLLSRALICNSPTQYPPRGPWRKGRWRLLQMDYIGFLKIVSACVLVVHELNTIPGQLVLITKRYNQRNFMYHKQWQHLTFYASCFLSGCAEVVSQNLLAQRWPALEQGAQVLSAFLSVPLMASHMQDTEGVELQAHMLLTQAMFLLSLVVTIELWAPDVLPIWVLKSLLYLVTGSWLMQIGFMLYKPISGYKWMDDDKNDIAFTTIFFCWHVVFGAICMVWIYGFSFVWHRFMVANA